MPSCIQIELEVAVGAESNRVNINNESIQGFLISC